MSVDPYAQNKHIVRRIYEDCLTEGHLEILDEIVASDFIGPNGEIGPDDFRTRLLALRTGIPDIRYTVAEVLAEGDHVAIRWTWTGHHTGTLFGVPPTGRSVDGRGISIYEVRRGKIVSAQVETDRLGFLQQLGLVPADVIPAPRGE